MTAVSIPRFDFTIPPELEAAEPPEARGLKRDEVRLMVSNCSSGEITHASFRDLPRFLSKGDILVINTSRTRNAAVKASRDDGTELVIHLSTHLEEDVWTVEVRAPDAAGKSHHFGESRQGEKLLLPGGATACLLGPYVSDCEPGAAPSATLWRAALSLRLPVDDYLMQHGFPIRYNYLKQPWPLQYFQTIYATESGSAEMPSAGRPFSDELLERLKSDGVGVAPLILHTGVSNTETHEPPYKEYYRLADETAEMVNEARAAGRRVIAVGTTVVRTLESLANARGRIHAGEGWTCLVIKPDSELRATGALLTGFHEPDASHLAILEALSGSTCIQTAYQEALEHRYLWHEFGDLHLILP